jgi:hypothetical protein
MLTILSIPNGELQEASKTISQEEIFRLVEWLSLKDDAVRYRAFLLLQNRSSLLDDVYPYWDLFRSKLKSDNSYQRSIGLMLIAENAKWDAENRMDAGIDEYLSLLNDEKPITVRQCVRSLGKIAAYKPGLRKTIADRLLSLLISRRSGNRCASSYCSTSWTLCSLYGKARTARK